MKLLNDVIIEHNNDMIIVPSGTIMEQYEDYNLWIRIYFEFINNMKITKDNIKEIEDTVEGARTDVDDWDMISIVVYEGSFVGETSITLSKKDIREFRESTGKELNINTFSEELKEVVNYHYFQKGIVEKAIRNDIKKAEGDMEINIEDININGSQVIIRFIANVDLTIAEEEPVYKGRVRGSYPDV